MLLCGALVVLGHAHLIRVLLCTLSRVSCRVIAHGVRLPEFRAGRIQLCAYFRVTRVDRRRPHPMWLFDLVFQRYTVQYEDIVGLNRKEAAR